MSAGSTDVGEVDSAAVRAGLVRTCVGCRQRSGKDSLLRVVAVQIDGSYAVQADPRGRMPGRGAYLHRSPECFDLALRRRAFGRALRISGAADVAPLRQDVVVDG